MTNTQRAKLDSCNRVAAYNTKYANELSTIKEYDAEKDNFLMSLGIINNAAQVQSRPAGTAGDAVTSAKETMANATNKYALRGQVKAKQAGNITLANKLNYPITYITWYFSKYKLC